jgi:polar amino acid transport system substrate-binding protein
MSKLTSKSRVFLALLLALAMTGALLLSGCGGSSNTDEVHLVTPGTITVGSDCDYPPFIQMNGTQPSGFEYDLINDVCQKLGYKLQYLSPQNFDTLIPAVASGTKMDLAISSFTINDERKKQIDFCLPYFISNQACVVKANSSYHSAQDLNGQVVAAQSGTTGAQWVQEYLPNATLKNLNNATDCLTALESNQVQAVFIDQPTAAAYVAKQYKDCRIAQSISTGEKYGFVISKSNTVLKNQINQALVDLENDGTIPKLFKQYFGSTEFMPKELKQMPTDGQ